MQETQWALRNPLWAVALSVGFLILGIALWQARGQPGPSTGLALGAVALGTLAAGHLHARVEAGRLRIRYFPLFVRRIPLTDVLGFAVVEFRPVRDFGGWGLRFGRGGVAHTVSGCHAVLLRLASHRDRYLGTRQPDAWAAALRAAGVHTDAHGVPLDPHAEVPATPEREQA